MKTMKEDLKPTWLDEGFVKQVLKSVEDLNDEEFTISKWQCTHAVPPGSNYLSLLYRLCVEYEINNDSRSISLIVKTPLEKGEVKEFVEKVDGYGKELRMYRDVIPRMDKIAGDCTTLTARSYVCSLHNSLVLEDLREQGYKMCDRLKQLDAAHCRQFLTSLAKFHGLTVAVSHEDPELIQSIGVSWFFSENEPEEFRKHNKEFTQFNLTAMATALESIGETRYAEIVRGKISTLPETLGTLFKPSGELRVLCHGDCWTTNVLFKYNNADQVVHAKLVDFQMVRSGTFAQDVIHFWWTSARPDVRENLQEEMFELYRKTLNQTLEDANLSERVTKEEFDNEINRFAPYSLQVCSSLLAVAMADPDDLLDFNDMTKEEFEKPLTEDSPLTKNYRSKYYKAMLPELLRQLERFGTFK